MRSKNVLGKDSQLTVPIDSYLRTGTGGLKSDRWARNSLIYRIGTKDREKYIIHNRSIHK